MRGGNRHVALVVLEAAALVFLAALCFQPPPGVRAFTRRGTLLAVLVLSPLWLALVYLLPLPAGLWAAIPGRSLYADLLSGAGMPVDQWRPMSLVPDATGTSLLAGIPLVAAFLGGLGTRLPQLKLILKVLVGAACLEVAFGLLQAAGGRELFFGLGVGRPFGTFANPNHFANYVAMALAAYVWLAWLGLWHSRRVHHMRPSEMRRKVALYAFGAMLLLTGVLMSRSRGAALGGLSAALAAFAVALTVGSRERNWRMTMLVLGGAVLAGISIVGFNTIASRFDVQTVASAASLRTQIAWTSLSGAMAFSPVGSGWGTYADVYPRFQPASITERVHHAHQDYAEMLFEGGIFAVLLMAVFAWLAITRAVYLVRAAVRNRRLRREEMAAAICGIGLLGFLLHSLVEFNMHIPANAIIASLFAGIYLRPLKPKEEEVPGD